MALTAPAQVNRKDVNILKHTMAAAKIYDGALVKQNAAGFLANCAAEKGAVFAGVALETVDNSGGSAGDKKMRIYKNGIFLLTGTGFAQTDVGQAVYATDENTITKTNAADIQLVGVIEEFESSTQVWVRIVVAQHGLEATIAAVATTGATNSTPYGFTSAAQADALVAAVNALIVLVGKNKLSSES